MKLKKRIDEKINDRILYNNLKSFSSAYKIARESAFEGLNIPALSSELNKIKAKSKEELLQLYNQFRTNAESKGAYVFNARDALSANQYIYDVCRRHNAQYLVKSKSMTSEEILLNDFLEGKGVEPIESDLGEWIIQLAKEHPSHMVMPAIHKSRAQVAEIFKCKLGEEVGEDDIKGMVRIARKRLRDYYFKAEVGLTGANFAVASTGTIGIVTNEGNARLTTTIPPVHIVLLGYDKLIPSFIDALKILRVLPKSATGQIISTYVTWLGGQIPSAKNETGLKEIHYVFLDNGRLDYYDNIKLKDAFKCIRCGSCANICPVYEMVGGHLFGHIYIGAIGLIKTVLLHGEDKAKDILKLCIECKACSDICPVGIDLQKLISNLKFSSTERFGLSPLKRFAYSNLLSKPDVFKLFMKAGALLQKPFIKEKYIPKIPFVHSSKNFRSLAPVSEKSFTQQFVESDASGLISESKVFFYPGCAVEYIYPGMGMSLVKMLTAQNIQVDIPCKSVCCGVPAIVSGDMRNSKKIVYENLRFMKDPDEYEAVIVLCPTCGSGIINDYDSLLEEDEQNLARVAKLKSKIKTVGQFIKDNGLHKANHSNRKVTYHSPCHQKRGLGYSPENLLQDLLGDNFVPLNDSDVCCGFGGTYSFDYAKISSGILDKKIENIISTDAEIVITDCPGCVMQIEGGLKKKGLNIDVIHLVDFINLI